MPPRVAPQESYHSAPVAETRPIVVVAGMHRSGTSLCARILSSVGVDIADDVGPGPGNEEGHWERWELVELHNRILTAVNRRNGDIGEYNPLHDLAPPPMWWGLPSVRAARSEIEAYLDKRMRIGEVFGFKDPRVSRLMPMWNQILERKGLSPRFVLCLRNPSEVADSLWKRDRIPHLVGLYRWLLYNCEFLAHAGVEYHLVHYEDWFEAPDDTIRRLAAFVGGVIPDDPALLHEMLRVISGQQRHNVSPPLSDSNLVGRVYQLLKRRPPDTQALQAISREFTAFSQTVPFEPALVSLQNDVHASASKVADLQSQSEKRALATSQSLAEREQLVGDLQRSVAEREKSIEDLHRSVAEREQSIAEMQRSNDELRRSVALGARAMEELENALASQSRVAAEIERKLEQAADREAHLGRKIGEQALDVERLSESLRTQAASAPLRLIDWLLVARDYLLLRRSGLFDGGWYSRRYPESPSQPRRRLAFFLSRGWLTGHNPNRLFDTKWYLERYPDVRRTRTNPVVHYLSRGADEGRDPGPKFSTANYLRDHPELQNREINPLSHYLEAEKARAKARANVAVGTPAGDQQADDLRDPSKAN